MVRRVALLMLFALGAAVASSGQMRTWAGRDFVLGILEPEGWIAETSDVGQIAHFVLHPLGKSWRDADSVIYVRLVQREGEESIEAFVEQNMENLRQSCPLIEFQDHALEIGGERKFTTKSYDCPGARYEIASVTEVPGYFALLALSARTENEFQTNLPIFKEVLGSFFWREREKIPSYPNQDREPPDPPEAPAGAAAAAR